MARNPHQSGNPTSGEMLGRRAFLDRMLRTSAGVALVAGGLSLSACSSEARPVNHSEREKQLEMYNLAIGTIQVDASRIASGMGEWESAVDASEQTASGVSLRRMIYGTSSGIRIAKGLPPRAPVRAVVAIEGEDIRVVYEDAEAGNGVDMRLTRTPENPSWAFMATHSVADPQNFLPPLSSANWLGLRSVEYYNQEGISGRIEATIPVPPPGEFSPLLAGPGLGAMQEITAPDSDTYNTNLAILNTQLGNLQITLEALMPYDGTPAFDSPATFN